MLRHQSYWAEDAVACDLIQIVLQESASLLAQGFDCPRVGDELDTRLRPLAV